MATNFFKIKSGIRIIPTSAPASPQEGDIYSDSTADIIYVYLDSAWREFLTDDQVQTISGKTFAQGLVFSAHNTHDIGTTGTRPKDLFLSGTADIDGNADVAGTATIGTLSVTGDATVTGNLTVNGTTTTLNTATLDVEDKNISVNKGGTTVGAEGSGLTVLGDSNTSIAEVLYDSTLASRFKAGVTGSEAQLATVSHTQTFTNKSIDADTNTITNIEDADIKAGAAIDATKIADGSVTNTEFQYIGGLTSDAQTQFNTGATNLSNHMSDTTTHGTTGDIVGTSDSQTISNKLIDSYTSRFIDGTDPTKRLEFNLGSIGTGVTQVVSAPAVAGGTMVLHDAAQTLSNKSINADANTITNIENDDIKAGAAIAVNKLAAVTASKALQSDASGFIEASTVTSTELGYVSGVTSAIQTQLGNKADSSSLTAHTGASSGVHGVTGSVVGTSDTQTLSNKTIDADSNTITNIENADIKAGAAIDAAKIADGTVTNTEFQYIGGLTSDAQTQLNSGVTALNNHMSDTTTHGTTGDIVGTSDTQTLTNKTLTSPSLGSPNVSDYTDFTYTTTPGSNPSGALRVYSKSDQKLYKLTPGGVETEIGTGGGGGSGLSVTTKTANYTTTTTDDVILCNTNAFTVTLPAASALSGKVLRIQKIGSDTNKITVSRAGSDTINGSTSLKLCVQYEELTIVSDGSSSWYIIDHSYPETSILFSDLSNQGMGSTTGNKVYRQKRGDRLVVHGYFGIPAGGATGTQAALLLPSYLLQDTSILGGSGQSMQGWFSTADANVGPTTMTFGANAGRTGVLFYDGTNSDALFFSSRSGSSGFTKTAGSSLFDADDQIAFYLEFKVVDWF